ncbi:MAG: NRDE family protein, partial [Porticoccaceae bacterium]|nr:NRDE family protein [Porticoccaceae bacterium]
KQAIAVDKIGAEQLPDLIATLSLEKTYAPELLPDTGVPAQWETLLSSPFIVADGYGTRASAAIIMRRSGEVDVAEHCFEAGASLGYQEFSFNLSAF